MKIPPKTPHFFKPILPGFTDGIKIPVSFFKYLGGKRYHQAVLRRGVKEWRVRIKDECLLREGWSTFSMENYLEVGDFVVFRHEGNMVFEVSVFDPTHCEREQPTSDDVRNADPNEAKENPSKRIKTEEIPGSKNKILRYNGEEAVSARVVYPKFFSKMKPGKLAHNGLTIPMKFARANGLDNRKCKIILRDEMGTSWSLMLTCDISHAFIRGGWKSFQDAQGMEKGDSFMIELVQNGKMPIFNFHCQGLKGNLTRTHMNAKNDKFIYSEGSSGEKKESTPKQKRGFPSHDEESYNTHFISTINHSTIRWSLLYLPAAFARSNGLSDRRCGLILRDPKGKSWYLNLNQKGRQAYIRRGLTLNEFFTENGLKQGDPFKFQLVENGKTPIVNFLTDFNPEPQSQPQPQPRSWQSSAMKMNGQQKEKRVEACHKSDNQPYFISTIMPYTIRKAVLYIPMRFAKSNGLAEKPKMILRDERQRLWPVRLLQNRHHLIISSGWQKFRKANGLKEGDTYKFEIVKKGERPVVDFIVINAF